MPLVRVKENEPFDVALRRFKRTIEKTGLLTELPAQPDAAQEKILIFIRSVFLRRCASSGMVCRATSAPFCVVFRYFAQVIFMA